MSKFKIKISPSWFSEDYVLFKYKTNGFFWSTIRECRFDRVDEQFVWENKTSDLSEAEHIINKFKTIKDINVFEEKEYQKYLNGNKQILEQNRKRKEKRDEIYRKFS